MRVAVIASAVCFSLAGLAVAGDAQASIRRHTDIPAQSLGTALQSLARQRDFQVVFRSEVVGDLRTNGAAGEFTLEEALKQLLAGTGLSFQYVDDKTITILSGQQLPPSAPNDTSSQQGARKTSSWDGFRLAQADQGSAAGGGSVASPVTVTIPEVLVEGKRSLNMDIQRTRDDPQPYVIFNREKISQSGAQNLEAFLRDRLSMNTSGITNAQTVNQAGAQSSFNLRGLGANQTLILIDGHRPGPGPSYSSTPRQSDINSIPLSAIERIEVLPATASGIYGGGATGGVINIILRRDYVGAEVKATYGNSFQSDVAQRRIDLSSGFNLEDGKTNVLVTASWSDQNSITLQERPELIERYYSIASANAPAQFLPPGNPPLGSTPNIRSADGSDLVLKSTGASLGSPFTFIPDGYTGTASDGGAGLVANAGRYNLSPADSLQAFTGDNVVLTQAPRSASARASVHREFSRSVRSFIEGSFSKTETTSPWVVNAGGALSPYRVAASAPNNPFTRDILVTVPTDSLAPRMATSIDNLRVLGGAIVSLPGSWRAEMDYTWARTRDRFDALQLAPGTDVAAVRTGALDVLRDTRSNPIDLSAFLTPTPVDALQEITFQDAALRVAGPVLELPAGAVTVSTLLEYRTEKFGESIQRLGSQALLYPARSADISSAYLETRIPLVAAKNGVPGVQELEVQLAARADEYRTHGKTNFVTVGSTTPIVSADNESSSVNPTVALRYQPTQDLVFRASYGTGFVAPDITQLASSPNVAPFTIFDPRRGGTATTLAPGQAVQGGNPDLRPEESKSFSAGFILTPRFLPELRLSLDYTRIEKTDNIALYPAGAQGIVNDEALLPGRVQRGPNLPGDPAGWAGPITLLDASRINIASSQVEAFDLQLDYQLDTRFGTFGFSTVATRQTHYRTRALASQPELENVGVAFNNPLAFTGSAELQWRYREWTVGWLARHYDDYLAANPSVPTNATVLALQGNGGRVPSQTYHDLFVNWKPDAPADGFAQVLRDAEFQLGVRNVFDKMPPFDASLFNTVRLLHSSLGDALGTTYQLSMTKRF